MGADSSKSFQHSFHNLSSEQVAFLNDAVNTVAPKRKDSITFEQFAKAFPRLDDTLARSLHTTYANNGKSDRVTLLSAIDLLHGSASDQSEVLAKMFETTDEMIHALCAAFSKHAGVEYSEKFAEYLTTELRNSKDRIDKWLIQSTIMIPLIRYIYGHVLSKPPPFLPHLSAESSIFDIDASIAVLNCHLPMGRRLNWSLLFSTSVHGSSFSQLYKRINGEGPCIVVVKTDTAKFGCFASDGFVCGPQYRGDANCFLFDLDNIHIYGATGKTTNYAYMNVQQASLPNGLGIAGYDDIWPFFIDEEFGTGLSRSNLTSFEKCCLSGSDKFHIKSLEVWRVGDKPKLSEEEEERVRSGKSILDKDPEARAILEMSGRKMHSEAYRQPDPDLED